MTHKTIQLSHKVVISSQQDLTYYQVEQFYNDYFTEYNYQLSFLNIPIGHQASQIDQMKIMQRLEGMYAASIANKIIQSRPFTDFFGYELVTPTVKTTSYGFVRGQVNPELTVYLITEAFELLESFGNVLIFKHPKPLNSNNIISIELSESTSIYSITYQS
ncbi:hypothetical protein [Mucilaginibacter sp.]|uniref:hypothetical protein n=1 Tax=Mucilaginibacter sp. TaxID=1882438 RepID=UPI0025E75AEB|nr:hypothetical protein [Mucilaginibacter sp.]